MSTHNNKKLNNTSANSPKCTCLGRSCPSLESRGLRRCAVVLHTLLCFFNFAGYPTGMPRSDGTDSGVPCSHESSEYAALWHERSPASPMKVSYDPSTHRVMHAWTITPDTSRLRDTRGHRPPRPCLAPFFAACALACGFWAGWQQRSRRQPRD